MFNAVNPNSRLPIFVAYMGFGTIIWQGNAKNEADAKTRAYADTCISIVWAKEIYK